MSTCRTGSRCGRTSTVFGRLYAVEDLAERIAAIADELDLVRLARPPGRQALGRAEDPRGARQGADQLAARCCCSTSRPPRSIPTPPTGCARGSSASASERGATVLLASHNMAEVERLCERVIIMKRGRIEDDDTPQRLLDALRPREPGGGLPRRRARPRRSRARGRAMSASSTSPLDARAASRRRDGAALSLSAALVLDAAARAHLLAGGAAVRLGLPAALHRAECRLLRARRRHVHRRRADVGHPVPRPARLLGLVPRGDVVAQPVEPDDQPAAADRVRLRR